MSVNALPIVGPALIFASVASALVPWPNRAGRMIIAICGGLVTFLPVLRTTPGEFLLGLMGQASAATMVFLALFLYARITRRYDRLFPSRAFLICILVIGVVFYPLTMGLTAFDPYDLGYRGLSLPALMLVLVAVGWVTRVSDIPCWVGLAALLFLIDGYGSRNLWDYLICPLDVVFAAGDLIVVTLWRWKDVRPAHVA